MEALASHPTVKPVALVADALLDCTARGDLVLDQFMGSGTTILAAEKIGRVAIGIEYEQRYVDVAILRWQRMTKLEATLAGDGRSFEDISAVRATEIEKPNPHPWKAADTKWLPGGPPAFDIGKAQGDQAGPDREASHG
jgi:hypothetical protein